MSMHEIEAAVRDEVLRMKRSGSTVHG